MIEEAEMARDSCAVCEMPAKEKYNGKDLCTHHYRERVRREAWE